MPPSSLVFRVGTRPSNLAVLQARQALDRWQGLGLGVAFELSRHSSPGDRDRATDLRESPPDFFTRDLDGAVREGTLDLAVHSAKDVPDPVPEGLDWFWLPWGEDPRDVLVLRPGVAVSALPAAPVVGVSSERRAAYALRRFPHARMQPIRGNIEERLQQLDAGRYDVLLMAAAALDRLGLPDRATERIPLAELPPPEGQGRLTVTYRLGDPRLNRLRSLFVTSVRFVSAGAGSAQHCTLAGRAALARAEVCLYDTLMDPGVLEFLPASARRLDVGKRCGDHKVPQAAITRAILDEARRGRNVVRLKGGDAGLFGRLAEELEALDRQALPYTVVPGVSSLNAATTGTGLLLTRRGVSRGFCALTPRGAGGKIEPFDAAARAALPVVFFMALRLANEVAKGMMEEAWPAETPAAVVLDAGSEAEQVRRTTLGGLGKAVEGISEDTAGLLMVGAICRYGGMESAGALRGARVGLTCSAALVDRAAAAVTDAGGRPIRMPLLQLVLRPEATEDLRGIERFDGIVLTSPSAARCFLDALGAAACDLRRVPRILTCGPGTAAVLRSAGLYPDLVPSSDFGVEGIRQALDPAAWKGRRVLRLRSDKAGPDLAEAFGACGAEVTDRILYDNIPLRYDACPACDAMFFASASAVETFVDQGFTPALRKATVLAIGHPTALALERAGIPVDVVGDPATVDGAIVSLARHFVAKDLGQA